MYAAGGRPAGQAIVRDAGKGRPWVEKNCEVAIASIDDADGLTKAFSGVDGVFLMTPPDFDPEPGFPKTHEAIAAVKAAISAAQPAKVVFLSTVGAQVPEFSLLNNSKITEEGLRSVRCPSPFCAPPGSWRIPAGMWKRRGRGSSALSCSRSTIQFQWWRRPILEVRRRTYFAKAGRVYVSSNSKDRAAIGQQYCRRLC